MNNIKALREKVGISQTEMSKRLGITNDYLCMIENNRRSPSLKLSMALAAELKVTLDELFFTKKTNKMFIN